MIQYLSNGNKAYSKERVEIYGQGRTIVIDNYRKSKYYGFKSSGMRKTQDKGHQELFRLFSNKSEMVGIQLFHLMKL